MRRRVLEVWTHSPVKAPEGLRDVVAHPGAQEKVLRQLATRRIVELGQR